MTYNDRLEALIEASRAAAKLLYLMRIELLRDRLPAGFRERMEPECEDKGQKLERAIFDLRHGTASVQQGEQP